jgi:hypothetical protein
LWGIFVFKHGFYDGGKVNNVMEFGNGVQFWAYPSPNIGTCESILSITAPMCSS